MTSAPKKNALGRGLGALIELDNVQTAGSSQINEIPLDSIEANPNQPRKTFDTEALEELAASIKELGVVQPVTLREISEGHYQIISGERRCRASRMAGLTSIPAYIKTADDEALMEMALVENIQREKTYRRIQIHTREAWREGWQETCHRYKPPAPAKAPRRGTVRA